MPFVYVCKSQLFFTKQLNDINNFPIPISNAGQGSQCRPVGLGRRVGPSAIPRRFPAIILGTGSHGGNSKEHNYP